MENEGLLFIPDISGFSRFVTRTEVDHSRMIIQELLEVLLSTNQLDLKVSEIEGDAILFYRFGTSPGIDELYRQVERMFREFHRHLMGYHLRRYCYCKACSGAIDLTLKIITHYGEFTGYSVSSFNKLIGKDVIVAHQLLKNDIMNHEYWLVTSSLAGPIAPTVDPAGRMQWESSSKHTDAGEVRYHFTQLGGLKNELTAEPLPERELSSSAKVLSFTRYYDTDIITLFHATGDFNNRSKWQEGVKSVEEIGHFLPRVGMKCRYIMENGESIIYSSSYSFGWERILFAETDERKRMSTRFTLEKTDEKKTRLTLDICVKSDPLSRMVFSLFRKKSVEQLYEKSLRNLEVLVKEIRLPG